MNQPDKQTRYRQRLARDGFFLEVPHGNSMWPMLRNRRDRFLAEPYERKPERFDLPVYYRASDGHVVVHRIVRVRNGAYVIRGDNCYADEHGITENDMLAVVTGFYRGEKLYRVTDAAYRRYVRIWTAIYPVRWLWHYSFYQLYRFVCRAAAKCRRMCRGADENGAR